MVKNILDVFPFPKAYCPGGIENIKAIYLGCDPSNRYSQSLTQSFDLPISESHISKNTEQLQQIGLDLNSVYFQNLCRNYFVEEISYNNVWHEAAELWIPNLKAELDAFPIASDCPVFLTAWKLYECLIINNGKKAKPRYFYEKPKLTPILSKDNRLGRPLFPLFMGAHNHYELKTDKWRDYKNRIKEYFNK